MERRRLIHAVFLFALPIVVAVFGLTPLAAALLVVLALLWRWLISLSSIVFPAKGPELILDTISLSHFAEKARWCLDRLGVSYTERPCAGVLGVVFAGRTVPRLRFRSGIVQSSIGNSAEVLRYLWGAYAVAQGERARFLEPTRDRLELEQRFDRYGVDLQIWVYYHLLLDRDLTLRAWGVENPLVPWWQRALLRPLFPLLAAFLRKAFRINAEHYAKAVSHIEEVLGDIESRLADGRRSILGGDESDYADITFAAISGLWLQPDGYGGGKADRCRIARNRVPAPMRADIERWIEDYPKASAFVARLYQEERMPGTKPVDAGPTSKPSDGTNTGAQ